jgi:hypothetical protein
MLGIVKDANGKRQAHIQNWFIKVRKALKQEIQNFKVEHTIKSE